MTSERPYVTGVVLAGGSGRRFGGPKHQMHFKGQRVLERIAGVLSRVVDELLVVGRPPLPDLSINIPGSHAVVDRVPQAGPLMGLATALSYCRSGSVVLVACDMPLLSGELLAYEVSLLSGFDAVVPEAEGRAQPLHAVYRTDIAETVEELIASGESSMMALLDRLKVRQVPPSEWRTISANGYSFFSVNTPDDLRIAESLS